MNTQITMQSDKGNYYITGEEIKHYGTAGHPFCITTHHVTEASDNHNGMLDEDAILACEKRGDGCGYKCNKSYTEHKEETSLKVFCKKPMTNKIKDRWHGKSRIKKELHQFLLKLKDKYGEKYAGFAFVKEDGKTGADEY